MNQKNFKFGKTVKIILPMFFAIIGFVFLSIPIALGDNCMDPGVGCVDSTTGSTNNFCDNMGQDDACAVGSFPGADCLINRCPTSGTAAYYVDGTPCSIAHEWGILNTSHDCINIGVWDTDENACVRCNGSLQGLTCGDSSQVYATDEANCSNWCTNTGSGQGNCEAGCGASSECDEKTPNTGDCGGAGGCVYNGGGGGCPAGQTDPHSACVTGTCQSVSGCGVSDCSACSGGACTVNCCDPITQICIGAQAGVCASDGYLCCNSCAARPGGDCGECAGSYRDNAWGAGPDHYGHGVGPRSGNSWCNLEPGNNLILCCEGSAISYRVSCNVAGSCSNVIQDRACKLLCCQNEIDSTFECDGHTCKAPGGCPAGQTDPHSACVAGTCQSVSGCGVSDCSACSGGPPLPPPTCDVSTGDECDATNPCTVAGETCNMTTCQCESSGGGSTVWPVTFTNPLDAESFEELIASVINWLLAIVGSIVLLFIIIAGIMYMTAAGDEAQLTRAKKMLFYTILGFAIILISYSLIKEIKDILGITN